MSKTRDATCTASRKGRSGQLCADLPLCIRFHVGILLINLKEWERRGANKGCQKEIALLKQNRSFIN